MGNDKPSKDIDLAIAALLDGASVALVKDGVLLGRADGHGVIPLLTVLRSLGGSAPGASVADKVIGRSVGMVIHDAGIAVAHAGLTSDAAVKYLRDKGVPFTYDTCVPYITDRTGKDMCPIEKMSVGREDENAVRRDIEARFLPREQRFDLKYGREHTEVVLPGGVETLTVMPADIPAIKDLKREFLNSLDKPIGSRPLAELARTSGRPVAIIVNDATRLANSDQFLPWLLDYLNAAGVNDDDMCIVFALGSHRAMPPLEMAEVVGNEVVRRVKCYNHDAEDHLVFYGNTRRGTPVYLNERVAHAPLRILTGSIVHHFFAGFGGGRKALVPGVAGRATIQANHSMMLSDGAEIGKLSGNPVNEDLTEAAKMVGGGFLVNVVLNESREITGVFSGDMEEAHAAGCALVNKMNGVALPWLADVVVASCGGYPKDINMYQAQKTLDNAAQAVKPGGEIVLLAECIDGVGSDTYHSWAKRYKTLPELEAALKANFVLGGHKAYAVSRLQARARVRLVSSFSEELAAELGFTHATNAQEAVSAALAGSGERPKVIVMPQGSLTVPVR